MQRNLFLIAGIVCAAMFASGPRAEAMITPVGVSLFPPFEIPFRDSSIVGARLNLFIGVHQSVYGFDLGVAGNMTDKDFGGLQFAGLFNRNKGHASIYGFQIAGLVNWNLNGSDIYGIQLAAGLNIDFGKSTTLVGLQIAALGNRVPQGTVVGAQIGLFNQAKQVFGFQLGLINLAQALHGIQLGLININKAGPLPFFPAVNIGL